MRNPIKSYFAPFRAKVAEAEAADYGVLFLELYFYVLLPYWIFDEICFTVDVYRYYAETNGLPWYTYFTVLNSMWIHFVLLGQDIVMLWHYFCLRSFSRQFFATLWLLLLAGNARYLFLCYFEMDTLYIEGILRYSIPYLVIIYYFYRRKYLFKNSQEEHEVP